MSKRRVHVWYAKHVGWQVAIDSHRSLSTMVVHECTTRREAEALAKELRAVLRRAKEAGK